MPSLFKCSFISLGRIALILAALQLAACNSPEDRAQNYYERGMKLVAQEDYVKASLEFRNALQLKKDLVEAWRALADIEQRNQNWESLIAIRRTIVELDPKDVDEKLRLARLLVVAKMPEDALNFVNAAVELDDQSSNAQGLKSLILFKLDDKKGAVREAQAALRKDVNNVEATVVIAAEKFARGDADGALAVLNRENAPYLNDIGVQLFKLKIFEQMQRLQTSRGRTAKADRTVSEGNSVSQSACEALHRSATASRRGERAADLGRCQSVRRRSGIGCRALSGHDERCGGCTTGTLSPKQCWSRSFPLSRRSGGIRFRSRQGRGEYSSSRGPRQRR